MTITLKATSFENIDDLKLYSFIPNNFSKRTIPNTFVMRDDLLCWKIGRIEGRIQAMDRRRLEAEIMADADGGIDTVLRLQTGDFNGLHVQAV